jgi:hypothetical protein
MITTGHKAAAVRPVDHTIPPCVLHPPSEQFQVQFGNALIPTVVSQVARWIPLPTAYVPFFQSSSRFACSIAFPNHSSERQLFGQPPRAESLGGATGSHWVISKTGINARREMLARKITDAAIVGLLGYRASEHGLKAEILVATRPARQVPHRDIPVSSELGTDFRES